MLRTARRRGATRTRPIATATGSRRRPAAAPAPDRSHRADATGAGRGNGTGGGSPPTGSRDAGQHRRPKTTAPSRRPRRAAGRTEAAERRHRPASRRQESEASVPKIKSHKAAQKRIGVTGSGKFIRVNAWSGHHLEIKSSRRTRRYAGKAVDRARARQAGPSPAAVPLGARSPHGSSQARRHGPQAPQAPPQRRGGPQGHASRG